MVLKIALLGSAPSSIQLAPFNDPSWTIWACSPGAYPHVKRLNAWFELHRWEPGKPWLHPDYITFMSKLNVPVYMIEPVPEIPTSVAYPKDGMLERFGPYFFTSTLAWMFAMAITSGADEIGLWGVDMAASEEWEGQRQACQFYIWMCKLCGIKITIPPESDLLIPSPLYGFQEVNPHHVKILARERELLGRLQVLDMELQQKSNEKFFVQGALEDNRYHLKTWITDPKALELAINGPVMLPDGNKLGSEPPPPQPAPVPTPAAASPVERPPLEAAPQTASATVVKPPKGNGDARNDLSGIAE